MTNVPIKTYSELIREKSDKDMNYENKDPEII